MKEIKKEITREQIVYEITKEELESIKIAERNRGRKDIINYLIFSLKNYRYELNFSGTQRFCLNLVEFLNGEKNIIENIYGYSFHYYINHIKE